LPATGLNTGPRKAKPEGTLASDEAWKTSHGASSSGSPLRWSESQRDEHRGGEHCNCSLGGKQAGVYDPPEEDVNCHSLQGHQALRQQRGHALAEQGVQEGAMRRAEVARVW